MLDGVAQVLLLRGISPTLSLVYHSRSNWALGGFVQLINRAKDELVTPDGFDAFVVEERRVFEARYGSFDAAVGRLETQGNLDPIRKVRSDYAKVRANERAEDPRFCRGGEEPVALRETGRRHTLIAAQPGPETLEALRKTLHRLIEEERVPPWKIADLGYHGVIESRLAQADLRKRRPCERGASRRRPLQGPGARGGS